MKQVKVFGDWIEYSEILNKTGIQFSRYALSKFIIKNNKKNINIPLLVRQ